MKTKSVKKVHTIETQSFEVLLLSCIIFFLPFFRGLFFEKEFYVGSLLMALLVIGTLVKNSIAKEKITFSTMIEYLTAALALLYILSFPLAVNKYLAAFETIKTLTYFSAFLIAANQIRKKEDISTITWTILLSSATVAIIGFGAAFGSFTYQDAYGAGMISSTFQYHNTFGAFMLATLFLAAGEIVSNQGWKRYSATAIGYLLFMGLVFSYSRGAWLLVPVVGLAFFLMLKQEALKTVVLSLIAILLSFAMTISFLYKAVHTSNGLIGWTLLIGGSCLAAGIGFAFNKYIAASFEKYITKRKFIIGMLIIGIFSIVLLTNGYVLRHLPETVADRVSTINARTFTVVERGVFYSDASGLIKDYPILGTGGGGWATLYGTYKTYDYTTTEVHNYVMQTWIEMGTVGVLLLIGIYVSFVWIGFKLVKNVEDGALSSKLLGVICAILAMISHNFIDFNMSLGAFAIVFWLLLGVVAAAYKNYDTTEKKLNIRLNIPNAPFLLLAALLFISSLTFNLSISNAARAETLINEGYYYEAIEHFESAAKQNPYNADYLLDLANLQLLIGANVEDETLIEASKENMEKALDRNDRDFGVLQNAITYYINIEDYDAVNKLLEKLIMYHPLSDHTYNFAVEAYDFMANDLMQKGEGEEAQKYFEKILMLQDKIEGISLLLAERRENLLQDVTDIPEWYIDQRFRINLEGSTLEKINFARSVVDR